MTLVGRLLGADRLTVKVAVVGPTGLATTVGPEIDTDGGGLGFRIVPVADGVRTWALVAAVEVDGEGLGGVVIGCGVDHDADGLLGRAGWMVCVAEGIAT